MEQFAADVRRTLLTYDASGQYQETMTTKEEVAT
jgi:hypothetical protein